MLTGRTQGFTLVELILVAAIMGIAAAIAIPLWVDWVPEYRLKSAARELYANMQWAKLEAVRRNAQCGIFFDANRGRYYVCSGSGADGFWTTVADNTVEKEIRLADYGSGLTFGHGTATSQTISGEGVFGAGGVTYSQALVLFGPTGISDAGSVYLQNRTQINAYAVGTLQSGVILLRKWDGRSWD